VSTLRNLLVLAPLVLALMLGFGGSGCADEPPRGQVDARIETHAVLSGEPTPAGLAYVQAVVEAHRAADALGEPAAQIDRLLLAVEREPPAADGTAELLHYELLARTAELMLETGDAERALRLLAPRLDPATSLPISRASARCVVALGDAAARTGDHTLAMGSYARALELLSLLLEEVES
jgi:hypothetical protein